MSGGNGKIDHVELQEKIRRQLKPQLPKRFYKHAAAARDEGGFAVLLDGRAVRTPGKARLVVPGQRLAEALAGEWDAQEDVINPATMPLTRLANTAIDRIAPERRHALGEVMPYAGTDLLCYRASSPQALEAKQAALWLPYLEAVKAGLGAELATTSRISHIEQPPEVAEAFKRWLDGLSPFQLAAVHTLTTLTGSVVLAYAAVADRAGADALFDAAHVDEHWQIAQWGEDAEARARFSERHGEIAAACRFLDLLDT